MDLAAASRALRGADPAAMAAEVRAALLGGATPYTRLDLAMDLQGGTAALSGTLASEAGEIGAGGSVDLLGPADVRLLVRPLAPEPQPGPELGLLLTGPYGAQRVPELAGLSRWLASRP